MGKKRITAAVVLAGGLLVSPVRPASESIGLGPEAALARECRLEITLCQTIDLKVIKWESCWTYRALCD